MGEAGEGQNDRAPGEEDRPSDALQAFRDRFEMPVTDERARRRSRSCKLAEDSAEMRVPARARARRSAATCRRAGASADAAGRPAARRLRARSSKATGEPRDLDHDGVRADA